MGGPGPRAGTPWAALVSACLGWMFDSMDLNIFTLLISPSISELIGSRNPADIAPVRRHLVRAGDPRRPSRGLSPMENRSLK